MIKNVVKKLDYIIGRTSHALLMLSGVITLLMGFVVTYGVIKRYVFHDPDPYAYEISIIFLLFCTVLSVAGVERLNRQIRNDIISALFPRSIQVVLNIVTPLLALVFCVILTWKSCNNALYALRIHQVSSSPWAVPLAPIKFFLPVGYGLVCLVLISKFFQGLIQIKDIKKRIE